MPTTRNPIIPPVPIADIGMPPPVPIEPTDDPGARLAWAGILGGLLALAALLGWLFLLAVRWDLIPLALILLGALIGVLAATAGIIHGMILDWRRARFVLAAQGDQVNDRLDYFKAWGAAVIATQEQYNARYYPPRATRPKRLLKVTNGNRVYWLDEDTGTMWKPGTPARVAAQDGAPTNHLPDEPPATLTRQQRKFLHLILSGRAYGARAVVGLELERGEYNAVTASLTAAGILYKQDGRTFALAPMLTDYRSAWAGANDDYRREIERRMETWALRLLAHTQQEA